MEVSDVMTSDIQICSPEDDVRKAANCMLEADTGSIPVCNGKKIVGMITDRDIAVRGVAKGMGPDTKLSELMTKDVEFAREADDTATIAKRMSDSQVRRLPVIDSNDEIVGMVSLGDLSRGTENDDANFALEGVSRKGSQHQQG